MAASSNGPTFPRWQIALALGATGAIGLGYLYLRQCREDTCKSKRDKFGKDKKTSNSIDDSSTSYKSPPKDETPFQKSQRIKNEGNAHFQKGRYDDAIQSYSEAIDFCPIESKHELSTYYQNRAAAFEQLKKWDKVIEDCTAALEFNVTYEKALYRRARAYETTKEWELCLDDINAVCLLQQFQNQSALYMADRVLKELGTMHAKKAMENKKPTIASKQFVKTYFASFCEDPVYKKLMDTSAEENLIGEGEVKGFLRAKLAFAQEDYDQVIQACTEEIDSSEAESRFLFEALSLRAAFNILRGCHAAAHEDLELIINNPNSELAIRVNVLIKRASLHMQLGELQRCLDDFNLAAELGPNVSDVYHHRGQIHLLMERTDDARADFTKAVQLNGSFAIGAVQKCYVEYRYALQEKDVALLTKAMSDFRACTERFSTCSEAYVLYAQVLAENQEFSQADRLYDSALAIEPTNGTIFVHKGLLQLAWKNDIEAAAGHMKEAIRTDPHCEFAYETLGTVEVQRGNLLIAVELFDKAISLARTEIEMAHLFSLRYAAESQQRITTRLGIGNTLLVGT